MSEVFKGVDVRRSGFTALVLAAFLVALTLLVGCGSSNEHTKTVLAMFRGNLARTGEYPGPGPSGSLELAWEFETDDAVLSSAAVAGGIVYFASNDHTLYALDAQTGKEEWRFKTDSWMSSSPAVSGGIVYFGSADHTLYALDAQTGQEKWAFKTGGRVDSSPAVAGGIVYFGSEDRTLYALDANTGQAKWEFETGDRVESSPAVAGGMVYIGSWDHKLYALDAKTGQEKWRFEADAFINSSPAVADGVLYFSSDHTLYALDAKTGQEKWRFEIDGFVLHSPTVSGRVVYCDSNDGYLNAFDAQTGQEKWRFEADDVIGSSPVVADGVIYFGSDIYLYSLDAQTGQEKWRFEADDSVSSSPAVVDGVVYFGSANGCLGALGTMGGFSSDDADGEIAATMAERPTTTTTEPPPPLIALAGYEQAEVRRVCVVVEDSYPGIEGGASPDLAQMVTDVLEGMDLVVVSPEHETEADATLTFMLQGRALSARYTGEDGGGSVRLYTGAILTGTAEFKVLGLGSESWKVSQTRETKMATFSYAQNDPADAPFEAAFEAPLMESVARVWGVEEAVLGVLSGCDADWWFEFWQADGSRWLDGVTTEIIAVLLDSRLAEGPGISARAYDALGWCLAMSDVPRKEKPVIVRALISDIDSGIYYSVEKAREALKYVVDSADDYEDCKSWDAEQWAEWADGAGF